MESSNANYDAPQEGVPYPLDAANDGAQPPSNLEESYELEESVECEADIHANDTVELEDIGEPVAAAGNYQPDDVDDTVADYIADLLKRISGDPSDAAASSNQVPAASQDVQQASPSQDSPSQASPSQASPSQASPSQASPSQASPSQADSTIDTDAADAAKSAERKPREPAVIPEALLDMSAMRDLANQSARGAIDTHDQRQNTKFAYTGLTLAGAVIVFTLILGQMTALPLSTRLYGSLVGLVVSLYLCLRYHHITEKLSASSDAAAAPADANAESVWERWPRTAKAALASFVAMAGCRFRKGAKPEPQ